MKREARRGLRLAIGILHILVQLVLLWYVAEAVSELRFAKQSANLTSIHRLLGYVAMMLGAFFIQYSAMKMLSRTHHTSYEK